MDARLDTASDECASFGALLQRHRLTAGLSREKFAERARLSSRGIFGLETDHIPPNEVLAHVEATAEHHVAWFAWVGFLGTASDGGDEGGRRGILHAGLYATIMASVATPACG